jgi:hypothetical protein
MPILTSSRRNIPHESDFDDISHKQHWNFLIISKTTFWKVSLALAEVPLPVGSSLQSEPSFLAQEAWHYNLLYQHARWHH